MSEELWSDVEPGQVVVMRNDMEGQREYLVVERREMDDGLSYGLVNLETDQYFPHHRFTLKQQVRDATDEELKRFTLWHLDQ